MIHVRPKYVIVFDEDTWGKIFSWPKLIDLDPLQLPCWVPVDLFEHPLETDKTHWMYHMTLGLSIDRSAIYTNLKVAE
jgi:hypothetical protein